MRSPYVRTIAMDAGVRLAQPDTSRSSSRISALLLAASYCSSAAVGAGIACLISGHPASDALSWLGHGSAEIGAVTLAVGTVLLHWPFKWAIDHWW